VIVRRPPRLAILADDLIWSTRLASIARVAGAEPVVASTIERFALALPGADAAIVDLALRVGDARAGIAAAQSTGVPVVAVGPHEDAAARKRALAAGATRVYAYRKLSEDGPRTIATWLDLPDPVNAGSADAGVVSGGG
jgi:hypothetical protein